MRLVSVGGPKKRLKIEEKKLCQSLFPWTSRRPTHETSRQPAMRPQESPHRPRGNPQSDLEATPTDLEASRDETSGQPARISRQAAMIRNEPYHTPGSKGGGACLCECSNEYLTTQQVGFVPEFHLYFQVFPLRFSFLVCCAWQGTKDINRMLKEAFQDGKNRQRYFSMLQIC